MQNLRRQSNAIPPPASPLQRAARWGRILASLAIISILFSERSSNSAQSVLKIAPLNSSTLLITWTNANYFLEEVPELKATSVWQVNASVPALLSNVYSVSLSATGGHRFFRLREIAGGGLPQDPASIAPSLKTTEITPFSSAIEFLYTGANAVQTGVTNGAIDPRRAAVLRGKVLQRDNSPLPAAVVSIAGHPEFGRTLTRADGMFDMAVNGGALLTAQFQKPGYCPAQRQIATLPQESFSLPDVTMMTMDPMVTPVALGLDAPMQIARASVQTDADGARQATLIFPPGTCADLRLPNGSSQPCSALHVRATEFTVGATGPAAMPALLPDNSAYTYCVELSADEAVVSGATDVRFNQPLCFYLENFLNFPVGSIVPAGYYDRQKQSWTASQNGRVIKLLSVTGGLADLDIDGDGTADDAATLAALGITNAERQRLASLYAPAQTLWRTCVTHFTPWDYNWPYGPPSDAEPPNQPPPGSDDPLDDPDIDCGSILEAQNQILGQRVGIVGTPFSLNYRSDRTPGGNAAYTLQIHLSGGRIPSSLTAIDLQVFVAGRGFFQRFPAAPNQTTTFSWDGKDAYGRDFPGRKNAVIRIGYVYRAVYQSPSQFGTAFATLSGVPLSANHARQEVTVWQQFGAKIGGWNQRGRSIGGWSLSAHHAYDPVGKVVYLGDGRRRSALILNNVFTTVAGNSTVDPYGGDGGQAAYTSLGESPNSVAAAPDGSLYIGTYSHVFHVAVNGIISTYAGNGSESDYGDSAPATSVGITVNDIALAPDGSLYIANNNDSVRRVTANGVITDFAGHPGHRGYSGDYGPAIDARFKNVSGITVGPDGTLYIADSGNNCIRRVGPDGIVTTIAGDGGDPGNAGDGGPASNARLYIPLDVAIRDGAISVLDGIPHIRRIGSDGIIRTIAGLGSTPGNGGPALTAGLAYSTKINFGPDGSLYIAERDARIVRRIDTQGIITTVAGNRTIGFSGDGGPPTQAQLSAVRDVSVAPDGTVFMADYQNWRVRKVGPSLPGLAVGDILIPSDDTSEIYVFNSEGRHMRTLAALGNGILFSFAYDNAGRLTSVTDGDGNTTSIDRDLFSNPTAVVGPYGQRTRLALDVNGWLTAITNPADETNSFGYSTSGLLLTLTNARLAAFSYSYDAFGHLIRDDDPAGGFKAFDRTRDTNSFTVTIGSALARTNSFKVQSLTTGGQKRVNTPPDGTQTEVTEEPDGSRKTRRSDGTIESLLSGSEPRWRMVAPLIKSLIVTTPGGLASTILAQRAVTLSNTNDPLTLTAQMDTIGVNGRTYTNTYTAATRTITNTSPAGRKITTTVDFQGRPLRRELNGLLPAQYSYGSRGRLTALTEGPGPDGRTNKFTYNAAGFLETITDPLGHVISFGYDLAGRVTTATLPGSRVVSFTYDANGNRTGITPPGRPVHTFSYSIVDLETNYLPPLVMAGANNTQYEYNKDRQLTRITRPDGDTVQFDYGDAGGCKCARLSSITQSRGTTVYTYDTATGKLTNLVAPGGLALAFRYDGSLLTNEMWSGAVAGTVSRTYNSDFRIASHSFNGANRIDYQYDADSRLTQAGALTINRDPPTRLIAGTSLGSVTDTRNYNGFGESINYAASYNGSPVLTIGYIRDRLGRITNQTETISGVTSVYAYEYDEIGRLTNVTQNAVPVASYSYDNNGNRLTFTGSAGIVNAAHDNQDRLTQYGTTTYSYTANGELRTRTSAGQTTTYTYDALGNLMSVVLPNGTLIEYLVDGRNRRIGKKVSGTLTQGFVYQDSLKPIAELDGNNNVVSRFVYATRRNVPDYIIKGGASYRVITDHLGSPRLVINVANGTIAQRLDYDEFGNIVADTNPGFQPFGFAGGLYDGNSKLVRFGARDYDAETGRWTIKDPIGFFGQDWNLYAYTSSDPLNLTDANGDLTLKQWIRIIGFLLGVKEPPPPPAPPPEGKPPACGPGPSPSPSASPSAADEPVTDNATEFRPDPDLPRKLVPWLIVIGAASLLLGAGGIPAF